MEPYEETCLTFERRDNSLYFKQFSKKINSEQSGLEETDSAGQLLSSISALELSSDYETLADQRIDFFDNRKEQKLTTVVPGLAKFVLDQTFALQDVGFTAMVQLTVTGKYNVEQFTNNQSIIGTQFVFLMPDSDGDEEEEGVEGQDG